MRRALARICREWGQGDVCVDDFLRIQFYRMPSSGVLQAPQGLEGLCHALQLHRNMEHVEWVGGGGDLGNVGKSKLIASHVST